MSLSHLTAIKHRRQMKKSQHLDSEALPKPSVVTTHPVALSPTPQRMRHVLSPWRIALYIFGMMASQLTTAHSSATMTLETVAPWK